MDKCVFCGASAELELQDAIERLESCHNCRVDIALNGQWTGHGLGVLKELVAKYGKVAVAKALDMKEKK